MEPGAPTSGAKVARLVGLRRRHKNDNDVRSWAPQPIAIMVRRWPGTAAPHGLRCASAMMTT